MRPVVSRLSCPLACSGIALLTLAFLWSLWLLTTMEMGEFSQLSGVRLMLALPVAFFLVLWFVSEFLAVRALGILFLLAAEPLLEAAFLRYEMSRLFVTVFAYILIVKRTLLGNDAVFACAITSAGRTRSTGRWRIAAPGALLYGAVLLFLAFTRY